MLVSQHRTCFRLNPAGSEGHERSPHCFNGSARASPSRRRGFADCEENRHSTEHTARAADKE
jgi:hypothetical protein